MIISLLNHPTPFAKTNFPLLKDLPLTIQIVLPATTSPDDIIIRLIFSTDERVPFSTSQHCIAARKVGALTASPQSQLYWPTMPVECSNECTPTHHPIIVNIIFIHVSSSSGLLLGLQRRGAGYRGGLAAVEGLFQFVVGRAPVLEFEYILGVVLALEHVPDGRADAISRKRHLLPLVFVLNADDVALANGDVGLRVPVVLGVEGQVVQVSFDVVPHDCNLGQSPVEGLGGWCVDDIPQAKNISVFFVLKGLPIHIEESRLIGQPCVGKSGMGGGGHQGVELAVGFFNKLP